jgi:ribosomal protein L16 Arg81 hydroxylase
MQPTQPTKGNITMPKQTETPNPNANAMNVLATKIKMEQSEYQLRLANYATPYGADPEQIDFVRAAKYVEDYGRQLPTTVFAQASSNLQERVAFTVDEILSRQESIEALLAAGAEIQATDEQLFSHAQERVFSSTRAGQQAAHANVA